MVKSRKHNSELVLAALKKQPGLDQIDLVEHTSLLLPEVCDACDYLTDLGIIKSYVRKGRHGWVLTVKTSEED